jgi:arylsulfatase A-like enzyme
MFEGAALQAIRWRSLWCGMPRPQLPLPGWQRAANLGIAAALLAAFAYQVDAYRFLGDDAFISFRYARNLVAGHGLVWNPGEAVEGYTNFLWVLAMAAGMAAGLEPEGLSVALGIASGLAVLALVLGRNVARYGWRQPLIWLAPAALVSSRSFTAWSTGGLETQAFALFALLAMLALCEERRRARTAPWIASVLFAVTALIRPEGALFAAVAGCCLAGDALLRGRSLKPAVLFALPFTAIVGAHYLWRHAYYGYWLPNTFYAKVHGLWWEQSRKYFSHFFADYRLHWFLPLALVPALARRRFDDVLWLATLAAYAGYVVTIGGDRFEFRFLVPVLPLVYVLVADGLYALWCLLPRATGFQRAAAAAVAAGVALGLVLATHLGSIRPEALRTRDAIASLGTIKNYAGQRAAEGRYLRDLVAEGVLPADLRVAVTGAGALPYYTMWPALDVYGLSDATIAHQPVRERSHVAHEQGLPPGYLAEKSVTVVDSLNRLVFGTDPKRLAPRVNRARRIARAIRLRDEANGLTTPARAKCLRLAEDRTMIFVTVVPEPEFQRVLGHLPVCGQRVRSAEPSAPRNVLLIAIDTLRADHTSAYGYERDTTPALARLAEAGVRFDRAYAPSSWTKPSVASIFTGQYPHRHGLNFVLATLPASAETLAERLASAGFATAGVVSHNFVDAENGFDQGFEMFDSAEAGGHSHESTAGVTKRARAYLERLRAAGRPFFLFVHYFDPHYEYRRHPQYGFAAESVGRLRGGEDIRDLRDMQPSLDADEVTFLEDVYDEEIRFTDAGIGELLDALEALGLADDTLVVVTADHGEELLERGWLGHTRTLYEEVVRVPFIVRARASAAAGRVVTTPVSLVSLAPTILDYAGVDAPDADFQGPSLRPLIDGSGDVELPPVRSEVRFIVLDPDNILAEKIAFKRSLIDGQFKLIKDFRAQTLELYDLERDPGERENLAAARPERVRQMLIGLKRTRGVETEAGAGDADVTLDPKDAELLRKLGYIDD